MARYHEMAMVPEYSSYTADRSAKWVTLFIATEYGFKPKRLLREVKAIAGRPCTVERMPDDPRHDSNIYKFFYQIRNATYQGITVAERLRTKIEAMEKRVEEMRKLHAPQQWLEEEEQGADKDA